MRNRKDKKDQRIKEAKERKVDYDKLTIDEKIEKCKQLGGKKQLAKLEKVKNK